MGKITRNEYGHEIKNDGKPGDNLLMVWKGEFYNRFSGVFPPRVR
ncbi:MAG: hypothetical protein CM1200mP22_31540 [Dehalococcoidia bacterium]|nr:MAG: hypothetical protein CM1200mP22_31540 [Dehalococcoidia bacterium]